MLRRLAVLAAGVAVALALTAYGAARALLGPAAEAAAPVLFVVEPGETVSSIARHLEREGLVTSALAVEWLARLREIPLRAGEYRLSAEQTPAQILARIAEGRSETWEVVLPEGLTAVEIAARLESAGLADAQAFLAVVRDPEVPAAFGVEGETLEGYLFPETYRLPRRLPAREVARVLVEHFLALWREIEPAARGRELSMKDAVTLASIVEKETGVPAERPLIAAVFANRLARGMRLETDPAVIYGISDFDGNLRRVHLEDERNPYNTYRHAGLPPGPIANPGEGALRAVVEPAETDYLYFVSRNDGTHVFSSTYRDHVNAVNRFQRRFAR